jgi:hypothetical protein
MDEQKFTALETLIGEVDGQGPATPEQAEAQAAAASAESAAQEWGSLAYMVGGALTMLAPVLSQVYTEDACLRWGKSVVPVSDKYGWGNPSNVPEVGLAISTLGFAVPSVLAIRASLAALRAASEKNKPAQRPAPAEVMAAAVHDSPVPTDGATDGG